MLAVEKWAHNKPYLIALFAPQMAANARDMHLAFHDIKQRRVFKKQFQLPRLRSWCAMYRSHNKPIDFMRGLMSGFSAFDEQCIDLGEAMIEGARLISSGKIDLCDFKPTVEDIQEILPVLQSALSASFREIEDDFSDKPMEESEEDATMQFFSDNDLESSFFMLVLVPCWLLYREHPSHLYRKARRGDIDAIEKLLRLDPLMLHDTAIGKQLQRLRFTNNVTDYESLLAAPLLPPKAKITRKKIKYTIAGFISALSTSIGKPLTEPEIRALFDAVAQDADGMPIDTDLPDSPEAFTRAIHRDRTFWLKMLDPDKKM